MRVGELALQKSQKQVHQQRQQGGGDGAGENHPVIHHGDAAKDEFPQAPGADGGGDGGHTLR